jgi:hypothetical protein
MHAAAVLTVAVALEHTDSPATAALIPLTRNEIAHLLTAAITPPAPSAMRRLRWSHWRRRHQHRSHTCHYQRQTAHDQGS